MGSLPGDGDFRDGEAGAGIRDAVSDGVFQLGGPFGDGAVGLAHARTD